MTVDITTSIGASGATGTVAITYYTSGSNIVLTLASGITFTLYGDISMGASNHASCSLTLSAGSSLVFAPPTGSTYKINMGNNNASPMLIIANGTSGSHCSITTTQGGGGNAYCATVGSVIGGLVTATYLDVSYMGSSSQWGMLTQVGTVYGSAPSNISITNCTFSHSNWELVGTAAFGGNITFNDNKFSNSVANGSNGAHYFSYSGAASGTPTWGFNRNYFDGLTYFAYVNAFSFQYNIFANGLNCGGNTPTAAWTQFDSNIEAGSDGSRTKGGSLTNFYHYNYSATNNPVGFTWKALGIDVVADGVIYESPLNTGGSAGNGDFMWPPSDSSTHNLTVRRCLGLPSNTGVGPGALVQLQLCSANPKTVVTAEHNTVCVTGGDAGGIIGFGQHINGVVPFAGQIASCRANIAWGATSIGGAVCLQNDNYGTVVSDIITVAGHNCTQSAATGDAYCNGTDYSLAGYGSPSSAIDHIHISSNGPLPNSQLGQGDVNLNPNFVDSTRNLCTWGQKVANVNGDGSLPTYSATLAWIRDNGPSTYIPSLFSWVRAGFRPQTAALKGTSYSGDSLATDASGNSWGGGATPDIGAMAYQSSGSAAPLIIIMTGGRAA
jgi:hypothetical protein